MKLSTRARYGLRLMLSLSHNYGGSPLFLRDIAEKEEISEKYLGQIVIALKSNGLIKSLRGAKGGYMLNKNPSKITVKDIVETLEGDLSLVDCIKDNNACKRMCTCVTRDIWSDLTESISKILASYSLKDLVKMKKKKMRKAASNMYNI